VSSSVDYRAYCEASVRELSRLTRVYLGSEDDKVLEAQHLNIDHLDKLLSGPLSPALRSLYMQEYSEIRAYLRAVAVVGLTRRDHYLDAATKAAYDSANLRDSAAFNESLGAAFMGALPEELKTSLSGLEAECVDRKTEVTSRLEAAGGFSSDQAGPTPQDVVRAAMAGTQGVSNNGVSRDQVRDINGN